jgi:hypothetical protein
VPFNDVGAEEGEGVLKALGNMMKLCEEIRKAFSSKLLCVVIPVFVQ